LRQGRRFHDGNGITGSRVGAFSRPALQELRNRTYHNMIDFRVQHCRDRIDDKHKPLVPRGRNEKRLFTEKDKQWIAEQFGESREQLEKAHTRQLTELYLSLARLASSDDFADLEDDLTDEPPPAE
jgi:hypothetical protein